MTAQQGHIAALTALRREEFLRQVARDVTGTLPSLAAAVDLAAAHEYPSGGWDIDEVQVLTAFTSRERCHALLGYSASARRGELAGAAMLSGYAQTIIDDSGNVAYEDITFAARPSSNLGRPPGRAA